MAQLPSTGSGTRRTPSPVARRLGPIVFSAIGALAAAWLWNRRGEAALHQRTAERLRPRPGGQVP